MAGSDPLIRWSSSVFILALLMILGLASADTITVSPNDPTPLQTVIDESSFGDTILLDEGVYPGPLAIPSGLSLAGIGNVTIDGLGIQETVLWIDGDGIQVSNVGVVNSSWDADSWMGSDSCIRLTGMYNSLSNLTIGSCYNGLNIKGGSDLQLSDIRIHDTERGIFLMDTYSSMIDRVDISGSTEGLRLSSIQYGVSFRDLLISDCAKGITTSTRIRSTGLVFINLTMRGIDDTGVYLVGHETATIEFHTSSFEDIGRVRNDDRVNESEAAIYLEGFASIVVDTFMTSGQVLGGALLLGVVCKEVGTVRIENVAASGLFISVDILESEFMTISNVTTSDMNGSVFVEGGSVLSIDRVLGTGVQLGVLVENVTDVTIKESSLSGVFNGVDAKYIGNLTIHNLSLRGVTNFGVRTENVTSVDMDGYHVGNSTGWATKLHSVYISIVNATISEMTGFIIVPPGDSRERLMRYHRFNDTRVIVDNVTCKEATLCVSIFDFRPSYDVVSIRNTTCMDCIGGFSIMDTDDIILGDVYIENHQHERNSNRSLVFGTSDSVHLRNVVVVNHGPPGFGVHFSQQSKEVIIENSSFDMGETHITVSTDGIFEMRDSLIISNTISLELWQVETIVIHDSEVIGEIYLEETWDSSFDLDIVNLTQTGRNGITSRVNVGPITGTILDSTFTGIGSGVGLELNNAVSGLNVTNCIFTGWTNGIIIDGSSQVNITSTIVSGNERALLLSGTMAVVNLTGNTISNNTIPLYSHKADGSITLFDNSFGYNEHPPVHVNPGAGLVMDSNQWSDYQGTDLGDGTGTAFDGIGDTDLPHAGFDMHPRLFDADSDGYPDIIDAFPSDGWEWLDSDRDGVGDNRDAFPEDSRFTLDSDGDGVPDTKDLHPLNPSLARDLDGDYVDDSIDRFPSDVTQFRDSDGDGHGDNASGLRGDVFPDDPGEWSDSDGDGVGDNGDIMPGVHSGPVQALSLLFMAGAGVYCFGRWT